MQARTKLLDNCFSLLGGGNRNETRPTGKHGRCFYGISEPRKADIADSAFLENLDDGQNPVASLGDRHQVEAVSRTECLNNLKIVLEL